MNERAIFEAALDRKDPEQRVAYLNEACGGDQPLRHHIEGLLKAHEMLGSFLAGPPPAPTATLDEPMTEGPGTIIGPYKLMEQIGEGGMGLVFVAEQQHPVRRKVAVKVIKPGMDTRQVVARFEAERQALAIMDHPNIAKVLDGGETGSGQPYFVMELVKGVPITEFCDQNQVPVRERLELFLDVCQAVQHAHQKGIIHRDIKPSNVLVMSQDGTPLVKVIDFGVAKAIGQQLTDKTVYTQFTQLIGTPLYMSPEQAGQSGLDVDTRSDIYSLGVLLYELLTGTTPFDKERLKDASYDEIRRIIREEEPPKPSTRISTLGQAATCLSTQRKSDPKRLCQLIRGELDWIVMKALEKDRNRRYETANGFAQDIQRYLADEAVLACPPSVAYRLRKFARRHKAGLWTAIAGALVLLLAAGGLSWALWNRAVQRVELAERMAETERAVSRSLGRAEELCDQATRMPSATSQQAKEALAVWQRAEDTLAQAQAAVDTGVADDPLRQRVQDLQQQIEQGRRRCEQQQTQALRKEKLLRDLDEARMTRLAIVKNQFDYARAAASYRDAFAAYGLELKPGQTPEPARRIRDEAPAIRDALIVALDDWAYSVASSASAKAELSAQHLRTIAATADDDPWRRKFRAAVTGNDRAALRSLSAEARESSLPPSCLVLLANTLYLPAEREEALALLRWGRSQHPTDFWVQYNLGGLLNRKTDATPVEVEEAIGCFRAAIALRPRASIVHLSLGLALHAKKQLDEAIAEYRAAIDLDPKDARPHYNLGSVLQAKNQLDEAIAEYRMAIKLDPTDAEAHTNLGIALVAKAKSAEAIAEQLLLDEAIAEFRAAIDIDSNLALAYNGLGTALTGKNQLDDAIANFHKAIKIDPKLGAQFNLGLIFTGKRQLDDAIIAYREAIHWKPDMFEAHNALGLALRDKGALQDAVKAFQKAADLKPDNAMVHSNLAGVLRATGQREKSIEAYRKALELWRKLAAGAPKNAGYQSAVGATLNDLAIEAFARKNPAEAARLLEEAVTYQKAARLIDPDNPRYRQFLRNHYSNLADALVQVGKHGEAAAAATEVPGLYPNGWREHLQAARVLAQCAALAAKDEELSEPKRKEVVNRYGEKAVTLLRQGADKGWKNVTALKDPVFEPLRSRDDFQKLLVELERKSKQ